MARRKIIRPLGEDPPKTRLYVITAATQGGNKGTDHRRRRVPEEDGRRIGLVHGSGIGESPGKIGARVSTYLFCMQGSNV